MTQTENHGDRPVVSFRDCLIKALDEERFDDMLLLMANRLRLRQQTVSPHARQAIPVDASKASPLRNHKLTPEEIRNYDINDRGWYLVGVHNHEIVGAERFRERHNDPEFKERVLDYVATIVTYYCKDALVLAAYHKEGMLIEWQFLNDFTAQPVR